MNTFDEFIAWNSNKVWLDICRNAGRSGRSSRLKSRWLKRQDQFKERITLAALASANRNYVFVATVVERGFNGRWRNVLVKDVHPFGVQNVWEDHLWLPYNRLWERIEPFYQGWKVVLVGKAVAYTRLNGTVDYAIEPEHVTTLLSREKLTKQRHVNDVTCAYTNNTVTNEGNKSYVTSYDCRPPLPAQHGDHTPALALKV